MNSAAGCLTTQQLQALLAGDSSDALCRAAANHVVTCTSCEARARQLGGNIDSVLSSLREPTVVLETSPQTPSLPTISTDPFLTRVDQRAAAVAHYPYFGRAQGPDEIGRLGQYRVLGLLGKGGMGLIFRAEDTALHRSVALKVMKPELATDREGCVRFMREAQVMAAIQHDHIVTVHQVGQEGQTVFLAMELLSGEPLDSWLRANPRRSFADIVRIGKEIASGLSVIHVNGVVHRDIKPSNIWMKRKDSDAPSRFQVKILDFGLAALLKADTDLTASGIALGTPAYMSPEQARGAKVDPRSDLFSLGCVLYELSAGRKPFADDHTMAALTSLAIDTPQSVNEFNPAVPPALSDLIDDLLEKGPADRPQSAQAVFERLLALETDVGGDDDTLALQSPTKRPSRAARRRRGARPVNSWWTTGRIVAATFAFAAAMGFGLIALSRTGAPAARQVAGINDARPVFLKELTVIEKEFYPFKHGDGKGFKKKGFKGDGKKDDDELPGIHVAGRFWPHGIFMHPPAPPDDGKPTSLSYRLGKKYSAFKSEVSINEDQESWAPQIFSVYGDGKVLWRSKEVISDENRQSCDVAVKGVDVLKIEVICAGDDVRGAHAVWLDPRVLP